ncbi:hypothetical protein GCM10008967_07990 [Bacillus carboniphilus]|uniref:Uncharacterized protein n=1 Tax=Bacillus carboniphilus TaxID=86663 RepID=A0ABN0VXM7_9BACI
MIGLWGATIGGFLLLLAVIGGFIYFIRLGLNVEQEEGEMEVKELLQNMKEEEARP